MSERTIHVTLVRHGESEANREKRWQGQSDSPLSDLGRLQARALRSRLGAHAFQHVVTSDLSRARETAQALDMPFRTDPAFREFDVGSWEGLTQQQVSERFAEEMAGLGRGEDVRLGGGESMSLFRARVGEAYQSLLASRSPGDHVLVVAHGGVIGAVLAGALGFTRREQWVLSRLANASVSQLVHSPEHVELSVFNDSAHLVPDPGSTGPEAEGLISVLSLGAPQGALGASGEQYVLDRDFGGLEPGQGPRLSDAIEELEARHKGGHVELRAPVELVHPWLSSFLWPNAGERAGARLAGPREGCVAQLGRFQGKRLLYAYR